MIVGSTVPSLICDLRHKVESFSRKNDFISLNCNYQHEILSACTGNMIYFTGTWYVGANCADNFFGKMPKINSTFFPLVYQLHQSDFISNLQSLRCPILVVNSIESFVKTVTQYLFLY